MRALLQRIGRRTRATLRMRCAFSSPSNPISVVATPIGNPKDITLRAAETLLKSDVIYCEDTRVTSRLLRSIAPKASKFPRLRSLHAHNESQRAPELIKDAKNGLRVAIASDAGTPAISDPAARVVESAHVEGIRVTPVPGPCAVTSLLSASGFPSKHIFIGFLPRKQGERRRRLEEALGLIGYAVVCFAPMRSAKDVVRTVVDIDPSIQAVMGREMTKPYEEIVRLSAGALLSRLESQEDEHMRGEATFAFTRTFITNGTEK